MKTVDALGLSCPEPVLLCRNAVNDGEFPFAIEVSDDTPKENIIRFAGSQKLSCNVEEIPEGYRLVIDK